MGTSVQVEKEQGVGTIFLNEPDSLNALSTTLKDALMNALGELSEDPAVKVIVLTGKGRAFCAGGDIRAMAGNVSTVQAKERMDDSVKIVQMIDRMKKPVIAAVHGYAAGAGFSIALAADLIVAEEGTKFGLAFKNVGLIPDLGAHYYLLKAIGPWKTKEWIWTGAMIPAEEGYRYGFVNRLVPAGQGYEQAKAWALELAEGPMQAYKYTKSILNQAAGLDLNQVLELENFSQSALRETKDHREGIQAFREKRPPRFIGE